MLGALLIGRLGRCYKLLWWFLNREGIFLEKSSDQWTFHCPYTACCHAKPFISSSWSAVMMQNLRLFQMAPSEQNSSEDTHSILSCLLCQNTTDIEVIWRFIMSHPRQFFLPHLNWLMRLVSVWKKFNAVSFYFLNHGATHLLYMRDVQWLHPCNIVPCSNSEQERWHRRKP